MSYQTLRTYTDGLWTRDRPPSSFVLAMLGTAVDPDRLDAAIRASLLAPPAPELSLGQRVVLEALRGFDDEQLVTAAPHIRDLLRDSPEVAHRLR